MTRSSVPAAALTTTALILLTACGGSDGDKGSDKIASTPPARATTSASASPSASATATVQRPVISFPPGSKTVYADQHTGDPEKDAVLADESHAVDSAYAAILEGKARTPAMEFYNSGTALRDAIDFVQGWLDKGDTWVGTVRYFDRKVTLRSDGSAVVIYCSDETKAFVKSTKTGKVSQDSASADDYVLYNERLLKSGQGVWILNSVTPKRGASECQP
ncbi:hypothetical protein ACIO6U_04890 [Streptomyces sp. NPDC087422]|uniref:hypothetical protein n=1 Tax=Streptomyces sp. NPDC087422 TaxID=3365786 RepID=UPI00381675B0